MKKKEKKIKNTRSPDDRGGRILVIILVVLIALVFFFLGGMFAYGQVLRDKFHPGVEVGGISIGGLTRPEAVSRVNQALRGYEKSGLKVTVGEATLSPSLATLGIAVDVEASLNTAFASGRESRFTKQFAVPAFFKDRSLPLTATIDEDTFKDYQESTIFSYTVPAKNSGLYVENGEIKEVPSEDGTSFTNATDPGALIGAVATLKPIAIPFQRTALPPDLVESDLGPYQDALAEMIHDPVLVTFEKRRLEIEPEDLSQTIALVYDPDYSDEEGSGVRFVLDHERLTTLLEPLATAAHVDAKPTFAFKAEILGEYALKNQQGRHIDIPESERRIIAAMQGDLPKRADLAVTAIDPETEFLTVDAPIKEGKAISVDLTRQSLFAFENGTLRFWTRVSTGKGGYKTPTGQWKIYNKTRRQVMQGPGYYLPNVEYVMPYNGDYTLHGAYWHTNFGTPMSHGCTNISNADAKWLFEWAEIGTPVVIYES